jgi:hypothetical protein
MTPYLWPKWVMVGAMRPGDYRLGGGDAKKVPVMMRHRAAFGRHWGDDGLDPDGLDGRFEHTDARNVERDLVL